MPSFSNKSYSYLKKIDWLPGKRTPKPVLPFTVTWGQRPGEQRKCRPSWPTAAFAAHTGDPDPVPDSPAPAPLLVRAPSSEPPWLTQPSLQPLPSVCRGWQWPLVGTVNSLFPYPSPSLSKSFNMVALATWLLEASRSVEIPGFVLSWLGAA